MREIRTGDSGVGIYNSKTPQRVRRDHVFLLVSFVFEEICGFIDSNGNVVVQYKYDAWGNHAVLYWNKVNDKEQYSDVDEVAFNENYAKNKAPEFIIRGLV